MTLHQAYLEALASVAKRSNDGNGFAAVVRRGNTFKSKYRHKAKFLTSNGHKGKIIPGLPIWASALVIVGIVIVALFLVSLIGHFFKERKLARNTGKSIRWGQILWGAVKIALFLWIPIAIFKGFKKCFKGRSSSSSKSMGMGMGKGKGKSKSVSGFTPFTTSEKGRYAEIEEDEQRLNAAGPDPKPWRMSDPPSEHDVDSRYEPMSYKPNVYNPYAAYAGAEPIQQRGRSTSNVSNAGLGATVDAPPTVSVSPPAPGEIFHQPPPPRESGDMGSRTPSPARATFEPGPAPAYYG